MHIYNKSIVQSGSGIKLRSHDDDDAIIHSLPPTQPLSETDLNIGETMVPPPGQLLELFCPKTAEGCNKEEICKW